MSDNRRIIYTRPDGGVSIIHPAGAIEDEIKAVPRGLPFEIVEVTADHFPLDGTFNEHGVPNMDKTFRNAWKAAGRKCEVDVEKAKGICHDKRRAARAAEFAPLDAEATIPAKAAEAEAKRQIVRDKYAVIQTAIDAAPTVEELKAAAAEVL